MSDTDKLNPSHQPDDKQAPETAEPKVISPAYKNKVTATERYLNSLPIKLKDRSIRRFHSKSENTGIVDEAMIDELEAYQEAAGIGKDGKLGNGTMRSLRNNDSDSFKQLSQYNYSDEDAINNKTLTNDLIGEQTPVKSRPICSGVTNCDEQKGHSIPNVNEGVYNSIVTAINSANPKVAVKQDINSKNIIAIRGAYLQGDTVVQSDSARRYMNYIYGHGTMADGRHFSTRYTEGSAPGSEFDDLFLTVWKDENGYFAQARKGSVDPNCMYSAGTSHLLDGNYDYKLKTHGTTHYDHMRGILEACADDPSIIDTLEIQFFDTSGHEIKGEKLQAIKDKIKQVNRERLIDKQDAEENGETASPDSGNHFQPREATTGLYFVNQKEPFKSFYGKTVTVETDKRAVTKNKTPDLIDVMNAVKNGEEKLKKITVDGFSNTFIKNNLDQFTFDSIRPGIQMNIVDEKSGKAEVCRISKMRYLGFSATTDSVRENKDVNDGILIRDKSVQVQKGANLAINIHTSSNERASSEGCQNVPIGQYVNFIREIREGKKAESNDKNAAIKASKPSINYILTDASKIK